MKTRQLSIGLVVFLLAILLVHDSAFACPNCKSQLSANYQAWAFGASVLFMMSMPFVLLGGWIVFAIRMTKTDLARLDHAEAVVE